MWDKYELIQSRLALTCSRLNLECFKVFAKLPPLCCFCATLPSCHSAVFAARGQRRMVREDKLIKRRRSGGHESVAAWDPPGPGPRALKSHATWRVTSAMRFCIEVSMPFTVSLPSFRWSRTGFQIVTVLMWLKDEFCVKILFVQLISSIDSTLNPIGHCHLSFLYFD